jgi:hypothetical protein
MWLRLKDENGIVCLVNLQQAKYIQPAVTADKEPAIKIVWTHDTFQDHGDMDLPDESCQYSEQIYTGISVHQIEVLLSKIGLTYPPTGNGSEKPIIEAPKKKKPVSKPATLESDEKNVEAPTAKNVSDEKNESSTSE